MLFSFYGSSFIYLSLSLCLFILSYLLSIRRLTHICNKSIEQANLEYTLLVIYKTSDSYCGTVWYDDSQTYISSFSFYFSLISHLFSLHFITFRKKFTFREQDRMAAFCSWKEEIITKINKQKYETWIN